MLHGHRSFSWKPWGYLLAIAYIYSQIQMGGSQLSINVKPKQPTAGQHVLLHILTKDRIQSISWYRGKNTEKEMKILTYHPDIKFITETGPQYTGRETLKADGSLKISNLPTTLSGFYTAQVIVSRTILEKIVEIVISPENFLESLMEEITTPAKTETGRWDYVYVIIGVAICTVTGIGFFIAALVICLKMFPRGTPEEVVYENMDDNFEHTNQIGSSGEIQQPDMRRHLSPYQGLTHAYQMKYTDLQGKQ